MSTITADAVRSFLLDRYSGQITSRGLAPESVPDDYDLLAQGIVDSLGILEMVGAVEQHIGFELDLETLDPDKLTLIGPFSRHVQQIAAARSA